MSKFIEVSVSGGKHFIAVATIAAISPEFFGGVTIFFTGSHLNRMSVDESYEEIKRLIWGAE